MHTAPPPSRTPLLGAITGDIIGSAHEFEGASTTEFGLFTHESQFTDDTVMTLAVASALLGDGPFEQCLRTLGRAYPHAGYGGMFSKWLADSTMGPYRSYGNGAAMRVSPVAYAFGSVDEVLVAARASAIVTHDHPEGVKGAQAIALAVFMARTGAGRDEIRREIAGRFDYDLSRSIASIRPGYRFDETCQGSVPEAVIAFLESESYEHAVRLAVSLGGDADTLACMAGEIASAFHGGVPASLAAESTQRLSPDLRAILDRFSQTFGSFADTKG